MHKNPNMYLGQLRFARFNAAPDLHRVAAPAFAKNDAALSLPIPELETELPFRVT
jgi:hypothetical protein